LNPQPAPEKSGMPRHVKERTDLKVALVFYWFVSHGGGEQVMDVLAEMFPQADLFCLVADPATMTPSLRKHRLTTSFLQRVPGARRWYRHFLPLHPLALEQLDLSGYDLVISLESGPTKGVLTHSETCHICYCLSPMRYIWDLYPEYRRQFGTIVRSVFSLTAHYMRMWDLASAARVDYFGAISQTVAARVQKHYRRDASIIYPPVNASAGCLSPEKDDYYLVVGRLVDYKRVDLAINACNRLKRRLRVIGKGDQYEKLRRLAGPNVEFLGHSDDQTVRENYSHCRALLFPGEEDFGIVPVEAQSFGRPVIAFGRGGALETVIGFFANNEQSPAISTGLFFTEQSADSLAEAILRFESIEKEFSPEFIRSNAQRFDVPRFKVEMYDFIDTCLANHRLSHVSLAPSLDSDPILNRKGSNAADSERGRPSG
jgi:glycosyltransferase involved in cell wall biosynthesis